MEAFNSPSPAEIARLRAMAESAVRERVMVDTFKGLIQSGTVRDKLRATHYQLSSSISALGYAAHWRGQQ